MSVSNNVRLEMGMNTKKSYKVSSYKIVDHRAFLFRLFIVYVFRAILYILSVQLFTDIFKITVIRIGSKEIKIHSLLKFR